MSDLPPIPLMLRTRLAHATLQAIADDCGADILHIKGAAVDASLRPTRIDAPPDATAEERALSRLSADADVLVRPAHVKRFLATLKQCGWRSLLDFDTGGGADHSAVFWHAEMCEADVHRSFPGIRLSPDLAFERLWQDRDTQDIAHRPCAVPSVDAQRLVLLLHAARNGQLEGDDVREAWTDASGGTRDRVRTLATEMHAEVALASATGSIDDFVDRPDYDLWRLSSTGGAGPFELWRARIKAARTARDKVRVLTNPLGFKTDALALELGRTPTTREVLRFYTDRLLADRGILLALTVRRAKRTMRPCDPRKLNSLAEVGLASPGVRLPFCGLLPANDGRPRWYVPHDHGICTQGRSRPRRHDR